MNVLLHVEPFPHIVLKQCKLKRVDEHRLMLSTNILLVFRLTLWASALWAQMGLWDLAFGLRWSWALALWVQMALWVLALWARVAFWALAFVSTHIRIAAVLWY